MRTWRPRAWPTAMRRWPAVWPAGRRGWVAVNTSWHDLLHSHIKCDLLTSLYSLVPWQPAIGPGHTLGDRPAQGWLSRCNS